MTEPVVTTDRDQVRWIQLQRPEFAQRADRETNAR